MPTITDWISAIASAASALVSAGAAYGVFLAYRQLRLTKEVAQLQFEDGMAKEYRELMEGIPAKALLGQSLSDDEYQETFDEFFRYIDLSNEQVSLRKRERISPTVWASWASGIQSNLDLPSFKRAWTEIKESKTSSFQELRRLEAESFKTDPATWT
jgi:hypothetical protein